MMWWQYHKPSETHRHHPHKRASRDITIRERGEKAAKCLCIRCLSETGVPGEAFQRGGHYPGTQAEIDI